MKKKITLVLEASDESNLQAVYLENKKPIDATKFTRTQKKNIVSLYLSVQPLIYKLMQEISGAPKVN